MFIYLKHIKMVLTKRQANTEPCYITLRKHLTVLRTQDNNLLVYFTIEQSKHGINYKSAFCLKMVSEDVLFCNY